MCAWILSSTFPAYLQGMETFRTNFRAALKASFPAYLQGMETDVGMALQAVEAGFPAYLQGMETQHNDLQHSCLVHRSQPTYKEWKQVLALIKDWGLEGVPSLPTRNGNSGPHGL